MTKWSSTWARRGRVGLILLACGGISLTACSKKKVEETKAQPEKAETDKNDKKRSQGDRYADGKRLQAALKDWSRRWRETAELPACDPLLKDAAELELCKNAATALTTMKDAAAKSEPEAKLIHDAAELAFASEAALDKLRAASMAKMQAEHKAGPASSAGGLKKVPPNALAAAPKAKPMGSSAFKAAGGKLGEKMKPKDAPAPDPAMQVMQAYSRVNRASLRFLSQFLQFGALPTRKLAFAELEGLAKRKETWPALGRVLREGAMAENDPELQNKLKALAPKLSRRPPYAGGARPGMPPGHPPMSAPAAPEKK